LTKEHRIRVSENRVLRKMFGPKKDDVTGEWRRLHNEGLHHLVSSQNIIRVTKARRMGWAGHVARIAHRKGAYLRDRDHLEDTGVDGRIILKLMFKKYELAIIRFRIFCLPDCYPKI
jgi:hypothetical protein